MTHSWEKYFNVSSEYWKKVEGVYEDSESFPKKVVKDRNLHHKFPRSFSKKDGTAIDNDDDNLVSLSLADHFRVHYYLWKCAKKGYRGMMAMAFTLMRKRVVVYATDETIERLAKDYEEAMKEAAEARKGKHISEEQKKKISKAMKGKKHSEESKKKISRAMKGKYIGKDNSFYGKRHSEEAKKKMSEAHKGKPSNMKGKHFSEEHNRKISEANKGNTNAKGTRWFNNGEINIRAKECPDGFVPGRIK